MRNQKKSGFRKLSGMNKVSLNADKHEGRFMHRAMKSMPWLICASTAWLTLVPCEIAFADDPPVPNDTNVLYNKIGVDTGGMVDGGQLDINNSVASEAVSKSKWYLTSNWAKLGDATNGYTTIQSGVTIGNNSNNNQWFMSGSLASNGTATNSSVTAINATVYGDVIGGDGVGGAHGNTVNIEGTTVSRFLYGGRCDNYENTDSENASDNTVIVLNSRVGVVSLSDGKTSDGSLAGGQTFKGNAQRNTVSITGSTIRTHSYGVYGGNTWNGTASNNVVEVLSGSTVQGYWPVAGGYAAHGTANSNTVTISGISSVTTTVYGGYASAEASSNTVSLSNSIAAISLYGGYAYEGTANSNTVTGTDSTVGWDVYGGYGNTGASSNTVNLSNVQVAGSVGGGDTTSGDASGNKVTLSNGTKFTGDLFAGYTGNGNATGNEVSLSDVTAPQYVSRALRKKVRLAAR